MANNPIAIDVNDLQYYDTQIKKYIDDKDAELKASLPTFDDIDKRVDIIAEKVSANEANIISHREELDDIEPQIVTINQQIADLRVTVENKLDESAMKYLATKEYVDQAISNVELNDYYTKIDADNKFAVAATVTEELSKKADKETTDTHTQKLATIENQLTVLNNKDAELDAAIKANETEIDKKATAADVYTKMDIDAKILTTGTIEHTAEGKAESVTISGTSISVIVDSYTKSEIDDKLANIDHSALEVATADKLGGVKSATGDNKVTVAADGVMSISSINVNTLTQTSDVMFILNGGTAAANA